MNDLIKCYHNGVKNIPGICNSIDIIYQIFLVLKHVYHPLDDMTLLRNQSETRLILAKCIKIG